MSIKVKSLYIYPVKSLGGISLQKSKVENMGLQYDRRWMLADANGNFVSQRKHPNLALLQPEIIGNELKISHKTLKVTPLTFSMEESDKELEKVTVWDDECDARPVSKEADQWFSDVLDMDVRLFQIPENAKRQADQRYAVSESDIVSYADGYPLLLISQASLDLFNEKAGTQLGMDRFRPNLVLEGLQAHEEDTLREFEVNGLTFFGVKPCARCVLTTVNQATAEKGAEPLKTLASYRKVDNKILFGENLIPASEGEIAVGNAVEILKRKAGRL